MMNISSLHGKFKFSWAILIIFSLVWSYVVFQPLVPISRLLTLVFLFCFCLLSKKIYNNFEEVIDFNYRDILVIFVLFFVSILFHGNRMFYSLGGDELYHAQQALFPLVFITDKISDLPPVSIEWLRESMWHIFHPYHTSVIDLWRIFGACLIVFSYLVFIVCRKKSWIPLTIILLLLFGFGLFLSPPAESHPPLRLLPLFISSIIFGLNSFALRLPSLLAGVFVSWLVYREVQRGQNSPVWSAMIGAITLFIPIVYYVSDSVEPSIFGYATWVILLIYLKRFLESKDDSDLIRASIVVGLGAMMRQSVIVAAILPAIFFIRYSKNRYKFSSYIPILFPILFIIPHLFTVKVLGHTADAVQMPPWELIFHSFDSGVGIMSVINSTGLIWVLFSVSIIYCIIYKSQYKYLLPLIGLIPAYVMFHIIWPYLWGIGRYQAEYIAPFITYLLIIYGILASKSKPFGLILFPFILSYGLEYHNNATLDTNYKEWPRMRISTTASFPYDKAIGLVKRGDAQGNFLILGGSPRYGKLFSWINGLSVAESNRHAFLQERLSQLLSNIPSVSKLGQLCNQENVRYILVQRGTRREDQHRFSNLSILIHRLERNGHKFGFIKNATFVNEDGGIIDVYTFKRL